MSTPFKALSDLLMSVSSPLDLHRILREQGKTNVVNAVAWGGSAAGVISDLVDTLRRYGEADLAFFQALVNQAPKELEKVRPVAAVWIGASNAARLTAPVVEAAVTAVVGVAQPATPTTSVTLTPIVRPNVLRIRHSSEGEDRFTVEVHGPQQHHASVQSPDAFMVPGSEVSLTVALQWRLEKSYLKGGPTAPFPPEAVDAALADWGRRAFQDLFGAVAATAAYTTLRHQGQLDVQIVSKDPAIFAWPWEAVIDLNGVEWGTDRQVRISRLPNDVPIRTPRDVPAADRIHVLLVTSRPKELDVLFQGVSGPMVSALSEPGRGAPVEIKLLRPPTLARLREELEEQPGRFQIVHFDGHGEVVGSLGRLLFEDERTGGDFVPVDALARTLVGLKVDTVLLTACRSASHTAGTQDPFASVATGLVRAGVGAVVAMAYNLHADAARIFAPAFYTSLAKTGDPLSATTAARLSLSNYRVRQGDGVSVSLPDWLVPVVYENNPYKMEIAAGSGRSPTEVPVLGNRPDALADVLVGRDAELLWLERVMVLKQPAALLVGLEGVGVSALAWSYLLWRGRTGGLEREPVWVDCKQPVGEDGGALSGFGAALALVGSRLGMAGIDVEGGLLPGEVEALGEELATRPRLIVLDEVHAMATPSGQIPGVTLLNALLRQLHGTRSRFILTAHDDCFGLASGLRVFRPVEPLSLEDSATMLALAIRNGGDVGCHAGSASVKQLAPKTRGYAALIAAIGPAVTSPHQVKRAVDLLDERAALLDAGKVRQVIGEVSPLLRNAAARPQPPRW